MYEEEKVKLKNCIGEYDRRITNLLNNFGWTTEITLKDYKSNQQQNKEKKCDKIDPLYPDILVAKNSVKFDMSSLQQIFTTPDKWNLPKKSSDFQINFSREEKLALYESVIQKTGKLTELEVSVLPLNENEGSNSSNKKMTFSEIVAMRRDEKRRRLKYRTTKTPPLSVTEEFRHLIEIQMQAYNQYLSHTTSQLLSEKKYLQNNSSKEHKRYRNKSIRQSISHNEKNYKRK